MSGPAMVVGAGEAAAAARAPTPEVVGRRLRIVTTSLSYFPEHHDGSSRLAYDEARYLAGLGHEVWLVGMAHAASTPEYSRDGALHVLRYRLPAFSSVDPTGNHQRAVRNLLRRYLREPVDVVHSHILLAGAAALRLYGASARTCYSLHSPVRPELLAARRGASLPERARLSVAALIRSRLEAWVLSRSNVITCDSNYTRGLVRSIHGPAAAGRMQVLPGWVDLSRFQIIENREAAKRSLDWPTDRPVLFCLRRFVPRMGLDVLLDAAVCVHSAGLRFHLVMAGDGPLRSQLMTRAVSLGLSGVATFPGAIGEERLPLMYGAADAFVLPSAELECFGLIAIEAMACGRPVLATPVGAIPETVGAFESAWVSAGAGAGDLAILLDSFIGGRLKTRSPVETRGFVAERHSVDDRVGELARLALGVPQAAA